MKLFSFISIACISFTYCTKKSSPPSTPADKIKVAVRPVGIDDDNITRSETDVMWVNINK